MSSSSSHPHPNPQQPIQGARFYHAPTAAAAATTTSSANCFSMVRQQQQQTPTAAAASCGWMSPPSFHSLNPTAAATSSSSVRVTPPKNHSSFNNTTSTTTTATATPIASPAPAGPQRAVSLDDDPAAACHRGGGSSRRPTSANGAAAQPQQQQQRYHYHIPAGLAPAAPPGTAGNSSGSGTIMRQQQQSKKEHPSARRIAAVVPPSPPLRQQHHHQQQSSSSSSAAAAAVVRQPPLSPWAAAPTTAQLPKHHRYVAVTLERPSLDVPWGLSLSLLDRRYLMLGQIVSIDNSNSSSNQPSVRNAWVADCAAPPTRFWNTSHRGANHNNSADADVAAFVRRELLREAPVQVVAAAAANDPATTTATTGLPAVLQPGDCLVAVAGRTVAQWDFCLPPIAAALRRKRTVSLLVYRNACAVARAAAAAAAVRSETRVAAASTSFPVALAAYGGLRSSLARLRLAGAAPAPAATAASSAAAVVTPPNSKRAVVAVRRRPPPPRNFCFRDPATGQPGIAYCDEACEWEPPHDDRSVGNFLPPVARFPEWLARRKAAWRNSYRVHPIRENWIQEEDEAEKRVSRKRKKSTNPTVEPSSSSTMAVAVVPHADFWTARGFASHAHWLAARSAQWKAGYSWNRQKRRRLEHDVREVVHLPTTTTTTTTAAACWHHDSEADDDSSSSNSNTFADWLRVRKNQWKVQRRKRQRERQLEEEEQLQQQAVEDSAAATAEQDASISEEMEGSSNSSSSSVAAKKRPPVVWIPSAAKKHPQSGELIAIDALLEEREREQKKALELRQQTPQLDISFLFDADLGCPDDAVTRIFTFLPPEEHGKMLGIDRATRQKLMQREKVWRQLCPKHWTLPRRPRKPWHTLYRIKLRAETEQYRKKWDDLLSKASSVLLNRDELQSIEKMVTEAERDWKFQVDYVSSVVCERNSVLNLAVIHQRHKVVRWLVETKGANIESSDRGNFTALLNAAYAGDRYLVRFLMQRGADRTKVGRFHYTKPLSSPDFEGLTAEGWAEKNGFADVAKLLRYGL